MFLKFKLALIFIILSWALPLYAQQPFLRFKPRSSRVDSFDFILSTPPFELINLRYCLAVEMRLNKSLTLKFNSSYMNLKKPVLIETQNLEIEQESVNEHFEEQWFIAILKKYRSQVYFGPYLGIGIEDRRTNFKMSSQVPDFEKEYFNFNSRKQSLLFAIGSTKLFSKGIIFDFSVALRFQYKLKNIGNFKIDGIGYRPGIGGLFNFTVGMPIGKRKFK